MAFVTPAQNARPSISDRIAAMVASIKESGRRHRTYRRTVNELSGLTDRELSDIGISRSMIHQIAVETANGVKND